MKKLSKNKQAEILINLIPANGKKSEFWKQIPSWGVRILAEFHSGLITFDEAKEKILNNKLEGEKVK